MRLLKLEISCSNELWLGLVTGVSTAAGVILWVSRVIGDEGGLTCEPLGVGVGVDMGGGGLGAVK